MNLKYMMLKDRYIFSYGHQFKLISPDDEKKRSSEISLYLKELSLYNIPIKILIKQTPTIKVKNELLNISYICAEENYFYKSIKANRRLPIKNLSSFTYKSKSFIEKWQYHILAYFLLLSNSNYYSLKNYLNIKNSKVAEENNDIVALHPINEPKIKLTGIILKMESKFAFIITSQGDFLKIKPDNYSEAFIGKICTGTIKKDLTYYKYPIFAVSISIFISILLLSYIYTKPSRTILIDANSSIKIKTNAWERTVETKPLSVYGNKITTGLPLFNKSIDDSIYLILKKALESTIISEKTQITIFLTGSKKESPSLVKTSAFISEHNLQVSINNNGIEHKIKKVQKQ